MIKGYIVFIDSSLATHLPSKCCAISTTPLLRELLIRSANFPMLYRRVGWSHLVTFLPDEIAAMPTGNLHLPMPADGRLRKIVDMIMDDSADRGTMQTWSQRGVK